MNIDKYNIHYVYTYICVYTLYIDTICVYTLYIYEYRQI